MKIPAENYVHIVSVLHWCLNVFSELLLLNYRVAICNSPSCLLGKEYDGGNCEFALTVLLSLRNHKVNVVTTKNSAYESKMAFSRKSEVTCI